MIVGLLFRLQPPPRYLHIDQGILRFDDGFDAADCFTDAGGESAPGDGSGIWNGATGLVVIKGDTTFTDCGTRVSRSVARGLQVLHAKLSVGCYGAEMMSCCAGCFPGELATTKT